MLHQPVGGRWALVVSLVKSQGRNGGVDAEAVSSSSGAAGRWRGETKRSTDDLLGETRLVRCRSGGGAAKSTPRVAFRRLPALSGGPPGAGA